MNKGQIQRKKQYKKWLFYIGCTVAALMMFKMFYLMAYGLTGSDIPSHTGFIVEFKERTFSELSLPHIMAYPLYHIVLHFVSIFAGNYQRASILVLIASNMATIFLVRKLLNNVAEAKPPAHQYLIDAISISSVFIMGICGVLSQGHFYSMQGGPNVWHNPTFLFARPFGMLSLIFFDKTWKDLKLNKKCLKEMVLFSLFLALSCLAKPSFAFVFLPAAGLFVAICLLKNKLQQFATLGLPLLFSVLPSILILLLQFFYVKSVSIGAIGLEIAFGTYNKLSVWQSILATVSLWTIIFYVFVTTGYRHLKKEAIYVVGLLMGMVGWVQFFFLQQGNGIATGDYFWGYGLAIHCATILSMIILIKYQDKKLLRWIGYGIYGLQLVYGIVYFIKIAFLGSSYYI